jgi:hypothetical protein
VRSAPRVELAFMVVGGASGRRQRAVSSGIKAITPLMAGGGYEGRRGLNRGNQGGGVNSLSGHLEAQSWCWCS